MLAIHAAALDKRFKAVVAHPAAFNFANFFDQVFLPTLVSHRLEMCSFLGATTLEEGTRLVRRGAHARGRGGPGGFPDPVGMLGR